MSEKNRWSRLADTLGHHQSKFLLLWWRARILRCYDNYWKLFHCIFRNRGRVYPTFITDKAGKDCWNNIFSTENKQECRIDAMSFERRVQARGLQASSDEQSAHNRWAHGTLSNETAHWHLQFRFVVHSELEKAAKADKVVPVNANLLRQGVHCDKIVSHRRLSEVFVVLNIRSGAPLNARVLDFPRENLALFFQEADTTVLCKRLWYFLDCYSSNEMHDGHIVKSIVTSASFDVCIATIVSCL